MPTILFIAFATHNNFDEIILLRVGNIYFQKKKNKKKKKKKTIILIVIHKLFVAYFSSLQ